MVQKYQNEISPVFYYGKKLKRLGKVLKLLYFQPPDWGQPYWMTLYVDICRYLSIFLDYRLYYTIIIDIIRITHLDLDIISWNTHTNRYLDVANFSLEIR